MAHQSPHTTRIWFSDIRHTHTGENNQSPLDCAVFLALLRSGVALDRVGNTGVLVLESSARASSYALTLARLGDSRRTDDAADRVRRTSDCGVFVADIILLAGVELVSFLSTAHPCSWSSPTHIVSLSMLSSSSLTIRLSLIIWLSSSISWSTSTDSKSWLSKLSIKHDVKCLWWNSPFLQDERCQNSI